MSQNEIPAGASSRNLQDKTGVSSSNLESPTTYLALEGFSFREALFVGRMMWRKLGCGPTSQLWTS